MRPIPVFALAVGLLTLGGVAVAEDKALKDLEGTYLLVGIEGKGLKRTEADFNKVPDADRKLVIKGNKITSYFGGKEDAATLAVDASQKPAHIDITSTKGGKTEVNYGIYKLESGDLTICALENGEAKERPKEFKADDKVIMMVLKKQVAK